MNRFFAISTVLSVSTFLLFTSCLDDDDGLTSCVQATGPVVTETRVVNDFHSVSLRGVGNILLTQGAPQSLSVQTREDVLTIVETSVIDEVLRIDLNGCIEGSIDQLDFLITIPDIRLLEIVGAGNISGQNSFDLEDLSINLAGVGNITLNGTTNMFDITSSGVGNIAAFDMVTDTCTVLVSGVGNVEVNVTDELTVTINGAGNVFYKGDPATVNQMINGTGSLSKVD